MSDKVRWGVLGVAKIATQKVIPPMQRLASAEIVAIASRDLDKARHAASTLGIPKAYGSYEELIADPEVEVIYNPLPNHLHVPWSIRAAEAGKHVLVEKPVSLNAAECRTLIEARDRTGVKIGEAFMVRTHPQWIHARDLLRSGEIGRLRSIATAFSFYGRDPANVRNILAYGGGGLMDLGCYAVQVARYFFGAEPTRVVSLIERDPEFKSIASPRSCSISPPASRFSPAACRCSRTSACSSSATRAASRSRSPSTRRPSAPPASSSTPPPASAPKSSPSATCTASRATSSPRPSAATAMCPPR